MTAPNPRRPSIAAELANGRDCSLTLPFPPATLSGHSKGHWRTKAAETKKHREWARLATLAVKWTVPANGDIPLHIRFVPPDRRGDRSNYPNRLKAAIDGIAEALGVNDRRFLPSYEFAEPEKPGHVTITILTAQDAGRQHDVRAA